MMGFVAVFLEHLALIIEVISTAGTVAMAGALGLALKITRKQQFSEQWHSSQDDVIVIGLGKKGNVTAAHITKHST